MGASDIFFELLFPPRCMFCGEVKPFRGECPDCRQTEASCRLVGPNRLNYLLSERAATGLAAVVSSYKYSGAATDVISRYKFHRRYYLAREMVSVLAKDAEELCGTDCFDAVVPVPEYKNSVSRHSQFLAKCLAKALKKPYLGDALIKNRATEPQHLLSWEQRARNLSGAFTVRDAKIISGKRVLLCDDVITSGHTLGECAKALLSAGVLGVSAAVFSATASPNVRADNSAV